jgi:hypothetical protein
MFLELVVRPVACRGCGKVKRERLDFLADNPLYTTAKFECKLRAVEQLAKLCGFNEPEKMEIEHGVQGAAGSR